MQTPKEDHANRVRRRLTDLYKLPGFQTMAELAVHPNRPGAVVLQLRRRKKNGDMFVLWADFTAAS